MKDRAFLLWLAERLGAVYDENPNADFVLKLLAIAEATPSEQETPNETPPRVIMNP